MAEIADSPENTSLSVEVESIDTVWDEDKLTSEMGSGTLPNYDTLPKKIVLDGKLNDLSNRVLEFSKLPENQDIEVGVVVTKNGNEVAYPNEIQKGLGAQISIGNKKDSEVNLASVHTHPNHSPSFFSEGDIAHMLDNTVSERVMLVHSGELTLMAVSSNITPQVPTEEAVNIRYHIGQRLEYIRGNYDTSTLDQFVTRHGRDPNDNEDWINFVKGVHQSQVVGIVRECKDLGIKLYSSPKGQSQFTQIEM